MNGQQQQDVELFRKEILKELTNISEQTNFGEDTLHSFKGKYEGKFVRFPRHPFNPAYVSINFTPPTVVAVLPSFDLVIPISKFNQMIRNKSIILQESE